jgi:RNA polymerase sigma-70 factor, ECF subfamily
MRAMEKAAARRPATLVEAGDPFLVELARRGDEDAVRVLVQRYNRRLYRVARAVLRNDADAEEVVRAFSALARFRGESSFATWITRIALNAAFGRLRRRSDVDDRESLGPDMTDMARVIVFPSSQLNPEQAMARSQVRELLEQVVEELPEPFRLVLVLRDVEDMSIEETAQHLGLKPATVKTRLHRARKLVRAGLAQRMANTLPDLFPFAGARCERMAHRVVERLRTGRASKTD